MIRNHISQRLRFICRRIICHRSSRHPISALNLVADEKKMANFYVPDLHRGMEEVLHVLIKFTVAYSSFNLITTNYLNTKDTKDYEEFFSLEPFLSFSYFSFFFRIRFARFCDHCTLIKPGCLIIRVDENTDNLWIEHYISILLLFI